MGDLVQEQTQTPFTDPASLRKPIDLPPSALRKRGSLKESSHVSFGLNTLNLGQDDTEMDGIVEDILSMEHFATKTSTTFLIDRIRKERQASLTDQTNIFPLDVKNGTTVKEVSDHNLYISNRPSRQSSLQSVGYEDDANRPIYISGLQGGDERRQSLEIRSKDSVHSVHSKSDDDSGHKTSSAHIDSRQSVQSIQERRSSFRADGRVSLQNVDRSSFRSIGKISGRSSERKLSFSPFKEKSMEDLQSGEIFYGIREDSPQSTLIAPLLSKRDSIKSSIAPSTSIDRPTLSLYPRRSITTVTQSHQFVTAEVIGKEGNASHISMVSLKRLNQIKTDASADPLYYLKSGSVQSSSKSLNSKSPSERVSSKNSVVSEQEIDIETDIPFVHERKESIKDASASVYTDYLLLQQRHDSSNFIQRIPSGEMDYSSEKSYSIKMLGSHLLGGRIGKGAFGKVKEGICTDSLQRVAVKIIAKNRVKKMVESVIREIKLLRRLKHQHVVTLVDVFAKVEDGEGKVGIFPWFLTIEQEPIVWIFEDGSEEERDVKVLKWYIVMEFCPCSLQTILDYDPDHRLSIQDSHSYFVQLVLGIEYLHSQKVIHRDIKPGNILITTDGLVKITDFGIAEQFDTYSGATMFCTTFSGTHQFLPPEVLTDESDCGYDGTKVDIWACGVVLYNMVSGSLPFEFEAESNIMELHEKIIRGVFEMPSEASLPCRDLLSNVVSRYSINQILTHSWTLSQHTRTLNVVEIPTFHHSKEDLGEALIPCDTTMLPYISQLYLKELEEEIKESGLIPDMMPEEEHDIKETKNRKINAGIGWIKRHISIN